MRERAAGNTDNIFRILSVENLEEIHCENDVDKASQLYGILGCIENIWLTKTVTSKINLVLLMQSIKIFYNAAAIWTVQNVDNEQAANIWK